MQIANKLHPIVYPSFDWHATSVKQFHLWAFASFRAFSLSPSLRHGRSVCNRFSRRPLARQGLAYQSTNCSMSQLYRYLINYKRAIAAAARHRPTLRGFSTLSGWFLLHATLITTPLLDFSIAVTVTTVSFHQRLFVIRRESDIWSERAVPPSKIISN